MGATNLGDLAPRTSYRLPDTLRSRLAKPLGPVLQRQDLSGVLADATIIVAVGDVVSLTLNQLGILPEVFVCDYHTERGKGSQGFQETLGHWGDHEIRVRNPAGTLTREAWLAVRQGLDLPGTVRIVVEGEEDLLGMAAFLEAPVGAKVLYGVPGQGVCVVHIDDRVQQEMAALLSDFEQPSGSDD